MSSKILVTYATGTGFTAGVAEAIGKTLRESGAEVEVRPMQEVSDLTSYSAVVALLMAAASIAGLVGDIYPTGALRQSFVANDVVNLVLGLPIFLWVMWSAVCWRRSIFTITISGRCPC